MSCMVPFINSNALFGSKRWIKPVINTSKLSMGTYGMRVNKKIIRGKIAMKKLKAKDDALKLRSSSKRPLKKNLLT